MQMSSGRLWIFVEGRDDRFFYHKLVEHIQEATRVRCAFEVVSADQIPDLGEGKSALLKLFDYMRSDRYLTDVFKGKRTVSIFYLDKDADDVNRKRRRSKHLTYTRYYCMENYAFRHGSLADTAASQLGIVPGQVRAIIGPALHWRRSANERWREWIMVCLAQQLLDLRHVRGFRSPSPLNAETYGLFDATALQRYVQSICVANSLTTDQWDTAYRTASVLTDRAYARCADRFFNGKWYPGFLEFDLARSQGKQFNANGVGKRVIRPLIQSLNFGDRWARHLRDGVMFGLVAALGSPTVPRPRGAPVLVATPSLRRSH
jgi:hypothetical protein